MTISISNLFLRVAPVVALGALVVSMDGTWATAQPVTTPAPRAATTAGSASSSPGSASSSPGSGPASARAAASAGAPASGAGVATGSGAGSPVSGMAASGSLPSGATPAAATEPAGERSPPRSGRKQVTGRLNLNTATEEQLMLLPAVGPSKAERIVVWRKKNGGFKRVADLRRVKGFGYKTFKRLEPFLDITGDTTLAPRR